MCVFSSSLHNLGIWQKCNFHIKTLKFRIKNIKYYFFLSFFIDPLSPRELLVWGLSSTSNGLEILSIIFRILLRSFIIFTFYNFYNVGVVFYSFLLTVVLLSYNFDLPYFCKIYLLIFLSCSIFFAPIARCKIQRSLNFSYNE